MMMYAYNTSIWELMQKYQKLKVFLGYIMSSKPAWGTGDGNKENKDLGSNKREGKKIVT